MSGLDRAPNFFSAGTRRMEAIITRLMVLSMTIMDNLLEVKHGFFFFLHFLLGHCGWFPPLS